MCQVASQTFASATGTLLHVDVTSVAIVDVVTVVDVFAVVDSSINLLLTLVFILVLLLLLRLMPFVIDLVLHAIVIDSC